MMRLKVLDTARRLATLSWAPPGADPLRPRLGPVTRQWRPFTVPNAITAVRLAFIPVFVWLLFGVDDRYAAAWVLGALGATDWVDGWFARRFDQVSEVGKVLDPVVDRLLLGVALVSLWIDASMPRWLIVAVVARELTMTAIAGWAASHGVRLDVTFLGKTATFFNMIAFPAFLVANSTASWAAEAEVLAWSAAAVGVVAGWWSVIDYVPRARGAVSAHERGSSRSV